MIPPAFEYLALTTALGGLAVAIFWNELKKQINTLHFWVGLGTFLVACFILDIVGLSLSWWVFPSDRNIQLLIFGLPIEEFILYAQIYVLAVCSWELELL